jgi:hypothetical protein
VFGYGVALSSRTLERTGYTKKIRHRAKVTPIDVSQSQNCESARRLRSNIMGCRIAKLMLKVSSRYDKCLKGNFRSR